MKRDEAKQLRNYTGINAIDLIDKIYDDFESRTCGTCIHLNEETMSLNSGTCIHFGRWNDGISVSYDDFCSQWEQK